MIFNPNQKPPIGSVVNLAHPFAQGLVGCWLFNEGSGNKVHDYSGQGNDGTISGVAAQSATSGWVLGPNGDALAFDGMDDYVDCGQKAITSPTKAVTIIANGTASALPPDLSFLGGKGNTGNRGYWLAVTSAKRIIFGAKVQLESSNAISLNTPFQAAGTYDGVSQKVYIDGIFGGSSAQTGLIDYTGITNFLIGQITDFTGLRWHNGLISHVFIYNRALSAEEIAYLYANPFCMFNRTTALESKGIPEALINADIKAVKWEFEVTDKNGTVYKTSEDDILITDFSGIELQRNLAENTIIAPSEITFNISNPSNALTFSDFKGGSVLVELFLSDFSVRRWSFRIKTASPGYQNLAITAEDFLQYYLTGYYPNTQYPQNLFPSDRTYENEALCVPVPFGTAYVPLRDVYITDQGYILLGSDDYTYTITKIRSPRSFGAKCEWDHATSTFTQYTKADAAAVNWKVFQAIIADSDIDGVDDSPGMWMTTGGPVSDPPVQFSRSDTTNTTNPADVLKFILLDMGVPAARINNASFDAAHLTYDSWGLEFNGAFWYKQEREKVIAQLLTMCHSCFQVGEQIELHVLSKTSQKTITSAEVLGTSEGGKGSFTYQDIVNEDLSDSGYVTWQDSDQVQDSFVKLIAPAGATASILSDETVECPFVQDSQDAQRVGTLHFQRTLLKEAEIRLTTKGTCLALKPDDVLTINQANYGGTYAVLIDSMKINKDLSIDFTCSKYTSNFDDWADVTPAVITLATDDSASSWQPAVSGPDSSTGTGQKPNLLYGRVRIGASSNYIVLDPGSPIRVSLHVADVEKMRFGNVNGLLDYVAETYGMVLGDATSYLSWDAVNGLRVSGAISASTIDIGGADATSFHVDINGNMWLGAATFDIATNPFAVSNAGVIRAVSGTIGGWVLGADSLTDAAGVVGMSSAVTAGDDIRFWAGNATPSLAPFYVAESGALVATSATIVGIITALSGNIGGWIVGNNTIADAAGMVGMSSAVTVGDDIRFWAGNTTPANAPFSVTEAGVLVATSATIVGDIKATTGHFVSVTLGETGVVSGTLTLQLLDGGGDTYIAYGKTDFSNAESGFILGIDDSDSNKAKIYIGDYLRWFSWNGTTLEYTSGLVVEPTIRLYVGGTIKTSDKALDGSGDSAGILINKDGVYAGGANQFPVSANVRILATGDAYFKGTITADAGYIGGIDGWTIAAKTLTGAADSKIISGLLESADWGAASGSQIDLFTSTIKFGGLNNPKFMVDSDGTMTAVGGIFKSSASGQRTQIDSDGITIYEVGIFGKYHEFNWGDGTKWGSGARVQIGNPSRHAPLYFPTASSYADIHLAERDETPSGEAEVNDIIAIAGTLYICTEAGTPGTWTAVGGGGDFLVMQVFS